MKQAIRALGWAIYIFWIILLFFIVTAVYSAFQFTPGFGDLSYTNVSNGSLVVSLPFSIKNGGLYDVSDLQLATLIKDGQGLRISNSTTLVPRIPRGNNVSATHTMSISFSQLASDTLSHVLFDDEALDVEFALRLSYASAVPFRISGNFSLPWGAPLSGLAIGDVSSLPYNATHRRAAVPVSFDNHSLISLEGTMQLELVDDGGHTLSYEITALDVLPDRSYSSILELIVPVSSTIREAHLFFNTSAFNYGPVVIPVV